ncbi:hypothetical protein EF87_09260 [Bacillus amyloliquefaciens]|nr:hypothetical protein EF87_09260 [Bacillus amyloliquefaciens]
MFRSRQEAIENTLYLSRTDTTPCFLLSFSCGSPFFLNFLIIYHIYLSSNKSEYVTKQLM